jgi:hypothetical protein
VDVECPDDANETEENIRAVRSCCYEIRCRDGNGEVVQPVTRSTVKKVGNKLSLGMTSLSLTYPMDTPLARRPSGNTGER